MRTSGQITKMIFCMALFPVMLLLLNSCANSLAKFKMNKGEDIYISLENNGQIKFTGFYPTGGPIHPRLYGLFTWSRPWEKGTWYIDDEGYIVLKRDDASYPIIRLNEYLKEHKGTRVGKHRVPELENPPPQENDSEKR